MKTEDCFDKRVLMCPPDYFEIAFEINPYMHLKNQVNKRRAWKEWEQLYSVIEDLGIKIDLLKPINGIPDMVFPADAGFVIPSSIASKTIVLSNFKYLERKRESEHYQRYFERVGYHVERLPKNINFEMNIQETKDFYLMAFGQRNDKKGTAYMERYFDKPSYIVELISPWFYHLSCAFVALNNETVLYYPGAFRDHDNELIERLFTRKIILKEDEALRLSANCAIIKNKVIMGSCSRRIEELLKNHDINYIVTPVEEFRKAGGSVGCMVFPSRRIEI